MQEHAIIKLDSVCFAWPSSAAPVLCIESLAVARNERVFIKGESGSGKTTLLSILGGVITAQQGEVNVLDKDLNKLSGAQRDHFRAEHIGFIFQMFNLIPYLSVLENVTLPCRFSKRRRDKALSRSGALENEAKRLLAHLDLADEQVLGRPVTELSVGQQQRVAAARALIGGPEILIADEPTSSLDADRRESFISLLLRECQEAHSTLVFVSHDAALEPLFDRSIALGKINRVSKS